MCFKNGGKRPQAEESKWNVGGGKGEETDSPTWLFPSSLHYILCSRAVISVLSYMSHPGKWSNQRVAGTRIYSWLVSAQVTPETCGWCGKRVSLGGPDLSPGVDVPKPGRQRHNRTQVQDSLRAQRTGWCEKKLTHEVTEAFCGNSRGETEFFWLSHFNRLGKVHRLCRNREKARPGMRMNLESVLPVAPGISEYLFSKRQAKCLLRG